MPNKNQKQETKTENQDSSVQGMREKLIARFGEKVEKWQKEFAPRKLNVIEVEGKYAVLRPVGVEEVGEYTMMIVNPEIGFTKASDYLLNELWIDGDSEILENEEYKIAAILQVRNALELKKSAFCTI